MYSVVWLIEKVLDIIIWILIINAIMSWLIAFNVINMRNRMVAQLYDLLQRLSDPVLQPIRRRLPNLGGVDISPMVVILLIMFLQRLIPELFGYLVG